MRRERTRARSELYAALGQGFSRPEPAPAGSASLPEVLRRAAHIYDADALEALGEQLIGSLELSDASEDGALRALQTEYNRLFFGPGRPQVPPYESCHCDRRGLVMGPSARDVERQYAEAGLGLAPDHRDLPDHVATELGFMAYLTREEARAEDRDRRLWVQRERRFLREHLSRWLPTFCRRVRKASQHGFYVALAELTETFVTLDTAWCQDRRE